MRLTTRSAAAVLLMVAGCAPPQRYLDVSVEQGAGATSRCVKVRLSADGAQPVETRAMLVVSGRALHVAVYQDQLPETVSVQAQGYSDDACTTRTVPTEESALTAATFGKTPTAVTLTVQRGAAVDADHDGFSPPSDCNDGDATVKPGAPELCSDGKDNDCSAGADCADPACNALACGAGATCVSGTCREQACDDGIDGDGDGTTDCADPDCAAAACGAGSTCVSGACHEQACTDGLDGDGDGATDCADTDCAAKACGTGTGAQCGSTRCIENACTDGVDNDGDALADCADSDCASSVCGVGGVCMGGLCVEPAETLCADGVSNDSDGLIDCADPDCAGQACTDGNACTLGEVCQGTTCGGGAAKMCTTPPGACFSAMGTCAMATGDCSYGPKAAAASCSDNDPCTISDGCNGSGGCLGSPQVCAAPPAGGCFAQGVCEPSFDGGCSYAVLAGASCNDGNNCTTGDQCAADGGCGGTPATCTPAECFVNAVPGCDGTGACQYTASPLGTACSGGGTCNGAGACTPAGTFLFPTDNFVPVMPTAPTAVLIDCALQFYSGPDAGFSAPCNGNALPTVSFADGGAAGQLAVLSMTNLVISDAGTLTLYGSRPVVLAVFGDADVNGAIFANSVTAGRQGPGASAALTCAARRGSNGGTSGNQGGGGGGGGFFTRGGNGGGGNNSAASGGDGGVADTGGDAPLLVGCPGGTGQSDTGGPTPGGVGGGALQLSVAGSLRLNAVVSTSAQGGEGGNGGGDPGGGGGGSGGALRVQALRLRVVGAAKLTANGGAGGGGAQGGAATPGADGATSSQTPANGGTNEGGGGAGGDGAAGSTPPIGGSPGGKGGGGGGGAMGRIFLEHYDLVTPCAVTGSPTISPIAVRVGCP